MHMSQYGGLTPLVQTAGWLIAAAVGISAAWRGRARWEPPLGDIPQGPAKVSVLVSAIGIGLLWTICYQQGSRGALMWWSIVLGMATVLILVFYGYFTSI